MTYSYRINHQSREAGVVSILTVILFMVFASILSVGFIKIVNDDQRQSTDSDLSASALASAQSGAEEAKRLLVLCRNAGAGDVALQNACSNALNKTACDAITGNGILRARLQLTDDGGHTVVSGNRDYQQRYTCMTISTYSDSVEGLAVEKGTSEVIPLVANGTYDRVKISWHATDTQRNGPLNAYPTSSQLPTEEVWGAAQYAALLRAQVTAYNKQGGGFTLSSLDANTRTAFLLPTRSTDPLSQQMLSLDGVSPRADDPNTLGFAGYLPQRASCDGTLDYACSITLMLPTGLPSSQFGYFLRLSSLYANADIRVQLLNGATPVQFDGVQPVIDVTGRANDVFRRVQTRVQFDSSTFLPQYALESGEICKDMLVTDASSTSSDFCNPGAPIQPVCSAGDRDIVLVMDASHSMVNNTYGGLGSQRAVVQRQAVNSFIDVMELSDTGNRLSIIQFHGSIAREQGLTIDKALLRNATTAAVNESETHYRVALNRADSILRGTGGRAGAQKVIIFLSDGRPNDLGDGSQAEILATRNYIMTKVNELSTLGFMIFSVAIDLNTNGSDVLQQMPRNGGGFYDANTESALSQHLQTIASQFACPNP